MKILGLDIGGANTDCTIIEIEKNEVISMKNNREYFPMWKNNAQLQNCLQNLTRDDPDIDVVCVSMTAELADGYCSKKEGVLDISNQVMKTFDEKEVYFVTFDGIWYSELTTEDKHDILLMVLPKRSEVALLRRDCDPSMT